MAKLIFYSLKLFFLISLLFIFFRESESITGGSIPKYGLFQNDPVPSYYVQIVQLHTEPYLSCSGIILNIDTILTAASCLYNKDTGEMNNLNEMDVHVFYRKMSTYIYDLPKLASKKFGVKEAYVHPNYEFLGIQDDIAILFLNQKIDDDLYNRYFFDDNDRNQFVAADQREQYKAESRACLDFRETNGRFKILGFGLNEPVTYNIKSDVYPSGIGKYREAFVKEDKEIGKNDFIFTIPEKEDGNQGLCYGDEGSPLINSDNYVVGIGITSYEHESENDPDVVTGCMGESYFSLLKNYQNFLNNVVGKSQYCAIRN